MTAPQRLVESWVDGGGSVCPYAKPAARILSHCNHEALLEATSRFVATIGADPNAALMILAPHREAVEFVAIRSWARQTFLWLMKRFLILGGLDEDVAVPHVDNVIRPMLYNDACPTRPWLSYLDEPMYSICMAPLYPKTHPRYAPHPIVVVTWYADVHAVRSKVADRMHKLMEREHGHVYDADELVLELPK